MIDDHLLRKNNMRKIRESAILEAKKSEKTLVACFDLQKVLLLPHSNVGILYYKGKVKILNFTVYDMATFQGYCHIWNETIARKGADEVASCLLKFIMYKFQQGFADFRFFSIVLVAKTEISTYSQCLCAQQQGLA